MEKKVNALLEKYSWARKLERWLSRFSVWTGWVIFLANIVLYLLIPVAAIWVRPTWLCVVVCSLLWTVSKVSRYVGFMILAQKGFQYLKAHCEAKRADKLAPKEKNS